MGRISGTSSTPATPVFPPTLDGAMPIPQTERELLHGAQLPDFPRNGSFEYPGNRLLCGEEPFTERVPGGHSGVDRLAKPANAGRYSGRFGIRPFRRTAPSCAREKGTGEIRMDRARRSPSM